MPLVCLAAFDCAGAACHEHQFSPAALDEILHSKRTRACRGDERPEDVRRPYRFRYRNDRTYRLHNAATGLLYRDILDKPILDWLCGFTELWASLLYLLAGQYEHAGLLGELITQADQASVAQDLGGDPARASVAPKQALQRKLLDGLRYLARQELKLNQPEASDGWLTQDALWLVSKTVCDKLRAHLLSQGIDGIPDKNTAVFNVLQDHGIALPAPSGKAIWKATVVSDGGWTQAFTFLKFSPALFWDASERPSAFTGTVSPEPATTDNPEVSAIASDASRQSSSATGIAIADTAQPLTAESDDSVGDLLTLLGEAGTPDASTPASTPDVDHEADAPNRYPTGLIHAKSSSAQPLAADEPLGAQFVSWLRSSIHARRLKINDAKALVHTVAGTAFLVTPGVFQRFVQEHPEVARLPRDPKFADWEWVQKNFEKLRLHKKQRNGLNIWTCEVTGPRKTRRLHGYLLNDSHTLFGDVPFDNPCLKVLMATDHQASNSTL